MAGRWRPWPIPGNTLTSKPVPTTYDGLAKTQETGLSDFWAHCLSRAYSHRQDAWVTFCEAITYAVALSCLKELDHENALHPVTPYYAMKIANL